MHEDFLRRAIQLAADNVRQGRGGPFGAVVARNGDVVAEGANCVTNCNDPTAHAEVVAIRDACRKLSSYDLRGCVIYASCEPCPMCLAAIYWARLDALYYAATRHDAARAGFDDSFLYEQIPLPDAQRSLPVVNLPANGAQQPFEAWRESGSKILY